MTTEIIIPSNPVDKENIFKSIKAIDESLTRIDGERDFIREEIKAMAEEYQIPAKYFNKMARAYHKQNIDAVQSEQESFVSLYEATITK